MAGISRCLCLLSLLSGALPMWGCADSNPTSPVSDPYQVVTISDLHFNPLYDPTLYSDLVEVDPSHWADIFQMSHVLTPTGDGTDTNYPLLVITLGDVKQHMRASPVVLFTGDMLGHNIPENFSCAYNNVKLPPANALRSPRRRLRQCSNSSTKRSPLWPRRSGHRRQCPSNLRAR